MVPSTAGLRNPQDLAWCDGLLIADTTNHRIRMLNADGSLATVAGTGTFGFGGDGGPATAAQLAFPTGLAALGAPCTVYVADTSNNRVRRFTLGATIDTVAGNGQTNAAKLAAGAGTEPADVPDLAAERCVGRSARRHALHQLQLRRAIYRFAPVP